MSIIYVVRGFGSIEIEVLDKAATFTINYIEDYAILLDAIKAARAAGATRGTLFTGEVNKEKIAELLRRVAFAGTTFTGGSVSQLPDSPNGCPQFKIEFEQLPTISELES
jgi:hypothetical protein